MALDPEAKLPVADDAAFILREKKIGLWRFRDCDPKPIFRATRFAVR